MTCLICGDIDVENAKKTVERAEAMEIKAAFFKAIALRVDVSNEESVEGFFKAASTFAQRIDYCVNTAGVRLFKNPKAEAN